MEKEIKLSENNEKTLMIAATSEIFEAAEKAVESVFEGVLDKNVSYPPDQGFDESLSDEEIKALLAIKDIPNSRSAIKKLIINSSGSAFFHFFNYLDGTSDPDKSFGDWTWATIVDHPKGDYDPYTEMLHDAFYDAYLDWKNLKSGTN